MLSFIYEFVVLFLYTSIITISHITLYKNNNYLPPSLTQSFNSTLYFLIQLTKFKLYKVSKISPWLKRCYPAPSTWYGIKMLSLSFLKYAISKLECNFNYTPGFFANNPLALYPANNTRAIKQFNELRSNRTPDYIIHARRSIRKESKTISLSRARARTQIHENYVTYIYPSSEQSRGNWDFFFS